MPACRAVRAERHRWPAAAAAADPEMAWAGARVPADSATAPAVAAAASADSRYSAAVEEEQVAEAVATAEAQVPRGRRRWGYLPRRSRAEGASRNRGPAVVAAPAEVKTMITERLERVGGWGEKMIRGRRALGFCRVIDCFFSRLMASRCGARAWSWRRLNDAEVGQVTQEFRGYYWRRSNFGLSVVDLSLYIYILFMFYT